MFDLVDLPPMPDSPSDPERTDLLMSPSSTSDEDSGLDTLAGRDPGSHLLMPECVGRYRVRRELARGGMGVILAAEDPDRTRDVAVKVLLPQHVGKAGYRERFASEARIAGLLVHPGVVEVYEVGELPDGRPFFVMQLIDGETLDARLAARATLADDLPHFLRVFGNVCEALGYAHGRGVLHRDLKPLNVMASPDGAVKVMDWGVACARGAEAKGAADSCLLPPAFLPHEVFGTPAYMSPEQANGGRGSDERTDVFGLGGILCAILTGHPPYTGTKTKKVHARAARADLAECFGRLDASSAPRELILLAKRCLSPHPTSRPRSALEVFAALTAHAFV